MAGLPALLVHKVCRVRQDQKDHKAHKEFREFQDRSVPKDHQAPKAQRVHKDLKARKGFLGLPAALGLLVHKERLARQVRKVLKDRWDRRDPMVQ